MDQIDGSDRDGRPAHSDDGFGEPAARRPAMYVPIQYGILGVVHGGTLARPLTWLAGVAGAVVVVALWLASMPWDMSTADENGRLLAHQPHYTWWSLLAVPVGLGAGALVVTALRPGPAGPALAIGGCIAWAVLYTWRASTARVVGANLWGVGLFIEVIPVSIAVLCLVAWVERARSRYAAR